VPAQAPPSFRRKRYEVHECDTGALVKELRKRIENGHRPKNVASPAESEPNWNAWEGFTLQEYIEQKRLGQYSERKKKWLGSLWLNSFFGLYEGEHRGKPVVAIPYMDSRGTLLSTKLRLLPGKDDSGIPKFFFKPKDPHVPYGLWLRINKPDADGNWPRDIVICEGESDVQTLVLNNIPALGISGSKGWRPEYARLPPIKNAERIFIIEEHDAEGPEFVQRVGKDLPPDRVFSLKLSHKDPNDLHTDVAIRREFGDRWISFEDELNAAIAQAKPLCQGVAKDDRPFDPVTSIEEERLPPFPKITGTIHELAEALCPSLPYEYKVGALMTIVGAIVSGKILLRRSAHIQPRLYTCLIGGPGSGKSGSLKRRRRRWPGLRRM
jgi:hypothetical protein